ncbi:hypothetical protein P167DRAFT_168432 [Morchella conica CCBAS932]|uniref:TECPR1-like DysF domain-containing protein n=1 Tax=Morchella conica CCBAS932 TaxID=1392247 RepID=A0A3N4L2J1_9PEZI|nr:hypothetical protein P167DRAFT_168432 [Morchella conica CCBAS932]
MSTGQNRSYKCPQLPQTNHCKHQKKSMDDSLLVDYDPSLRNRRYSMSDSENDAGRGARRRRATSPSPSLRDIGKTLAGAAHQAHKHHRRHKSRSSDSGSTHSDTQEGGHGASGLQERIFAKLMQQMLPSDYTWESYSDTRDKRKDKDRPQFSLTTMSSNFRRFNARIGVVFVFQHRLIRLIQWREPSHTLAALAVYSFVCLDPYLLAVLPVACVLLFIMVPSFIIRHPPPPSLHMENYNAHGPAIAPPPEVKAVSEMSKDFFRNLRDLQNTMDDFSIAHDKIISLIGPPTNFSDEVVSSAVFITLLLTSILLFISASALPWRFIFLISGWIGLALCHPTLQELLLDLHAAHLRPQEARAAASADSLIHSDIVLDAIPESREVEVFELQRLTGSGGEYESWIFSPTPYEPMEPSRIAGDRPKGTRFFEDVRCPPGWEWMEGKWTLDLGSTVWVMERYIGGESQEEVPVEAG